MGRSPCCEKVGLKKGPWTPEEDQKLLAYIEKHGHGSWRALPAKAGLQRCGKSCRLRWTNYLRPDIKRGKFSLQEEQTIIQLHALLGNRWSAIATHLPKRTDNEIKNYWNTHLKKRLTKMGIDPMTHKPKTDTLGSVDGRASAADANLSHMAQWESARLEAEARLAGEAKLQLTNSTNSFQSCHVAPVRPPLCLDVLKAWQGLRARPKYGAVLESPTSTLTTFSSENSVPIGAFGFGDHGSVSLENSMGYVASSDMGVLGIEEGAWSTGLDGVKAEEDDDQVAPMVNFTDGFTDLLLGNNSDVRNTDEYEENKNYWNNILNLVDSSPSDSTVF